MVSLKSGSGILGIEPLVGLWYKALESEIGIEVECSDTENTRVQLYQVRKEANDPQLAALSLTISPFDPTRIWLIKKEARNAAARRSQDK